MVAQGHLRSSRHQHRAVTPYAALATHAYWETRIQMGDPLFDQWMVEAHQTSLEAAIAIDRMIASQCLAITEDEPGYPKQTDPHYHISNVQDILV